MSAYSRVAGGETFQFFLSGEAMTFFGVGDYKFFYQTIGFGRRVFHGDGSGGKFRQLRFDNDFIKKRANIFLKQSVEHSAFRRLVNRKAERFVFFIFRFYFRRLKLKRQEGEKTGSCCARETNSG